MSWYRKVDTRMYGDAKFRQLSRPQPCGQHLWLWLLTGPATCIIPGVIYNVGPLGISELLRWDEKGFLKAFQEVLDLGMAEADFNAPLIFIPNAIKYNPPQSANVVTAWADAWEQIPECALKTKIREVLKAYFEGMSEGFREAFDKACPKTTSNQEQKQEQLTGTVNSEQEQQKRRAAGAAADVRHISSSGFEHQAEQLPEWITANRSLHEAWEGFVEMRKKIKHPLTKRAKDLAISELEKLRNAGHDPIAVLNRSTLNAWRGLFPLDKPVTKARGNGKAGHVDITAIDHTAGHEKRSDGSLIF